LAQSLDLHPDSGLLRGIGLFETMRAYRGNIIYFNQHIARIRSSGKIFGLELPFSTGKIRKIVKRLLALGSLSDARLRLTLWQDDGGSEIMVAASGYKPYPLNKYKQGFSAGIASLRQGQDSFLAQHKTSSRLIYEANFYEAQRRGFDEAIMLNQRGDITEATRSNIFFAKNKTLFTPALDCGCLSGITRRVVGDLAAQYGIELYEGRFTLEDLYAADEAFLTNSLMGIMSLRRVENKYLIKCKTLKITGLFMREYNGLLRRG